MKNINADEFNKIKAEGKAIFQFSANWCGPCRTLSPVLEDISRKTGVDVYKIDIAENNALAQEYNVKSIPAVFFFNNGKKIHEFVGSKPINLILNEVQQKYGIL
jgi:thioredoxin 1